MYEDINKAFFEFAFTVRNLLARGWELEKINYREAKYGGPILLIRRGEERVQIDSPSDVSRLIEKEAYEEALRKWHDPATS